MLATSRTKIIASRMFDLHKAFTTAMLLYESGQSEDLEKADLLLVDLRDEFASLVRARKDRAP